MNRTRWTLLCASIFVFALSTACLTLFPGPTQPAPTAPSDETVRGPLKFDPASLPNAQVGVPYKVEIRVTENVTPVGDFMVDPETLPPGLELVIVDDLQDTARIIGIPEKRGTYTFAIDVWCYGTNVSGQTGGKKYTILVE